MSLSFLRVPEYDLTLSNNVKGKIQTIFNKRRKGFINECRDQKRS